MKSNINRFMLTVVLLLSATSAFAQTSVFTYQGKLTDAGAAPTAQYDLTFRLFDAAAGGSQVGPDAVRDDIQVTAGIFTVNLDFGAAAFASGADRFLEISVRPGVSTGSFTSLSPLQPLTSSPFSIKSLSSSSTDSISATCVLCVGDAHIFSVDGSKVTGAVSSAAIAANVSGVVAIANGGTGSPTKNFADLTTNQTIAGRKTFVDPIIGDGSLLTNVNATIADGAVTTPKLADGSVTKAKLAIDFKNGFDSQKVAMMRWDQIPVVPTLADVGRTPSALAFDGTFMYVANKLDNNVMRLRTSNGLIEGPPIPVGNAPAALVYDGFRSIWVANSAAGTVSRISILNAAVDMTINVGSQPCALAFDGTLIYVGDCNSNMVTRVTRNGVIVDSIIVGHKSISLAFDGTYMYVSEPIDPDTGASGNVRRIAGSGAVQTIPPLSGTGVAAGALAFDGTFVYVASGSSVLRIRSSTGTYETRDISVIGPLMLSAFALVFDGTSLFGSGGDSGSTGANADVVVKLSRTGLTSERNALPTQGTINALAFDGTYVYAASSRTMADPQGGTIVLNGVVTRF